MKSSPWSSLSCANGSRPVAEATSDRSWLRLNHSATCALTDGFTADEFTRAENSSDISAAVPSATWGASSGPRLSRNPSSSAERGIPSCPSRLRTASSPTRSSSTLAASASPADAASTARSPRLNVCAARWCQRPATDTPSVLVRSTTSAGSRRPSSNAAATSTSSGTTPRPPIGRVMKSSPESTASPRSRSVTRTATFAPDSASSSSAASVDANDRRPAAARRGSRLSWGLIRRELRRGSSVPRLGSGGVPTNGVLSARARDHQMVTRLSGSSHSSSDSVTPNAS